MPIRKYGRAFSALGERLKPISQDACMFYENHGLFRNIYRRGCTKDEGDLIAQALEETQRW
ncbi:hypothetical protein P4S73_04470 [Paraglaciecola sp. Hal342]